jgi:uncharacterized protein YdhG (YjbR/CyaY superfamily)
MAEAHRSSSRFRRRGQQFESVDDYIASFPPEVQGELQAARRTIRAAAPDAEESISYAIPTFSVAGRPVVYLSGWKKHISIYPVPELDESIEPQTCSLSVRKEHGQIPPRKADPPGVDHRFGRTTSGTARLTSAVGHRRVGNRLFGLKHGWAEFCMVAVRLQRA